MNSYSAGSCWAWPILFVLLGSGPKATAQELLVSGYTSKEVHRYSLVDGSYQGPLDSVASPQALVYGPDGLLYVAAEGGDEVLRYDPATLAPLGPFVFDDPVTPQDETGGLDNPTGLAFGPDGNLYVASFETDSVLRYDGATGTFLGDFVPAGGGGLDGPDAGLTFGPDGHLYVPSYFTDQVLRFDGGSGAFLDDFVSVQEGGLQRPRMLVFRSDGVLFVSGDTSNSVHRYDRAGAFMDRFFSFVRVTGFGISPLDGNVYATSVRSNSVVRFDGTTGARIDTFVASGSGGLDDAVFVAFLPDLAVTLGRVEPGIAGSVNSVAVRGALPNSVIWVLVGTQGGSLKLGGCPHGYLGIADPQLIAVRTDATGNALLQGTLDGSFAGTTLLLQVVDLASCRISNLVEQSF